MGVDATAQAATLGIAVEYQDARQGAAKRLPQRIAVFAQGQTGESFSLDKWELTSAAASSARYGSRSPINLIARVLRPASGKGVGTISVDIIPLADGTTAAAGAIVPSGTATAASTYKVRCGGVLSAGFTIPAGAITVSDVCKDMGQACQSVGHWPGIIGWTYDTITEDHTGNTGDGTLTELSASLTTCIPGDWVLTCTAEASDGGTFKLVDPDGTEVADDIALPGTPGGNVVFDEGGLTGKITDGAEDFDVGDKFTITVPALTVTVTIPWKGASGNSVVLEVIDTLEDLTFTITQPTGGATNPTVDTPLTKVGDVWETLVLNALEIADTTALDAFKTWGEARYAEVVHKPPWVFTGYCGTSEDDIKTVSDARKSDRINCQLNGVGSPDLPFIVAAQQLVHIAVTANDDPAMGFGGPTSGLTPGDPDDQLDWEARDRVLKAGASTIVVKDNTIWVDDVVTMYHPEGDDLPAYRWGDTITKIQNVIYNVGLIFNGTKWRKHPLVADDAATKNPNARKPKQAIADLATMIDELEAAAIVADAEASKATIKAPIDPDNPRRLNPEFTAVLSSPLGIVSVTFRFAFYFGS